MMTFCVYHTLSEVNCVMFDMMIELVMYLSNHRMMHMCVHDMMKVAYVLPKCQFISVSANFGQTLYVLFLGKIMPNFCKRV